MCAHSGAYEAWEIYWWSENNVRFLFIWAREKTEMSNFQHTARGECSHSCSHVCFTKSFSFAQPQSRKWEEKLRLSRWKLSTNFMQSSAATGVMQARHSCATVAEIQLYDDFSYLFQKLGQKYNNNCVIHLYIFTNKWRSEVEEKYKYIKARKTRWGGREVCKSDDRSFPRVCVFLTSILKHINIDL